MLDEAEVFQLHSSYGDSAVGPLPAVLSGSQLQLDSIFPCYFLPPCSFSELK